MLLKIRGKRDYNKCNGCESEYHTGGCFHEKSTRTDSDAEPAAGLRPGARRPGARLQRLRRNGEHHRHGRGREGQRHHLRLEQARPRLSQRERLDRRVQELPQHRREAHRAGGFHRAQRQPEYHDGLGRPAGHDDREQGHVLHAGRERRAQGRERGLRQLRRRAVDGNQKQLHRRRVADRRVRGRDAGHSLH